MGTGTENILIFAGGLVLILLLISLVVMINVFGHSRREAKSRLDKLKSRFGTKAKIGNAQVKAFKLHSTETGLAKTLLQFIPRPELLQARLESADLDIPLGRYGVICAGLSIGITGFCIVTGMAISTALMVGVIGGAGLPHMMVSRMINSRVTAFTKQFPEALDLIVRGLKSGLPVNECIINVGTEISAPTGPEFRRIADEMKLGKQLETALWETADRLDTADFKFFVISLVVQRETGGNLGETLGNLGTILRQRQAMKMKIKAMSSEAKASAWIIGSLPFIMLGIIMTINYDYGVVLFTHPKAIMAGLGGLVSISIGIFIMNSMMNFEV